MTKEQEELTAQLREVRERRRVLQTEAYATLGNAGGPAWWALRALAVPLSFQEDEAEQRLTSLAQPGATAEETEGCRLAALMIRFERAGWEELSIRSRLESTYAALRTGPACEFCKVQMSKPHADDPWTCVTEWCHILRG